MRRRGVLTAGGALVLASTLPSFAQAPADMRHVGYLAQNQSGTLRKRLAEALREQGWREGEDYRFEFRVAGEDPARWALVARELAEARVDVIVAVGTHMAVASRQATATIPIVMMLSGYPVEAGLVASLARPGGNVTGLRTYADGIWAKYLELLREVVPTLRELGTLSDYVPPRFPEKEFEAGYRDMRRAAETLGIRLREWRIHGSSDLERALAELEKAPVQALFVTSGPTHSQPQNISRIGALVLRRRLPMMNDIAGTLFRGANGLMTYAVDFHEVATRTASFIHRVLKGAKPGDLPIEQPSRIDVVVSLKTARAIGITVPRSVLLRADRVVE